MLSSEIQENTASMEKKHNKSRAPDNRLLVDQAKTNNTKQLVIATNMAPNPSYLPPDIVEEILDLLPNKSIERFRSVSKSLFSLLAIKFNASKLLHKPCITSQYGMKSSDDHDLFTGVVLSDYSGGHGLFLNGALHWIPRESSRGEKGEIIAAIAFDLEKEKFHLVLGPPTQISPAGYVSSLGVVGEYLFFSRSDGSRNIIWVMKEYCNEASWVPFITYSLLQFSLGEIEYVCDFIPRSFKDGRYMMLQFPHNLHVLKWDNNLEESDEAGEYSKEIKFGRAGGNASVPYTQTLTSPYVS
ncbi:hypothetical protein Tsubulata_037119 [Turnera subulata]|uniref:F-box domain-containing protein n=1 Tax=Turnera subulata TaxID=218843 RepID=A0A9Q0G9Q8_9ROSI|nr:hypothetical protein Tsubulata_037119 [Turnera subulata]